MESSSVRIRISEMNELTNEEVKRPRVSRCETASESHLRILRDEESCDVIFVVGLSSETISCHKLYLTPRSEVFEAMLSERWNSEANPEIRIPDIEPASFRKFLEFVYADVFEMTGIQEALDLLYVAQKYDVQILVNKLHYFFERTMKLEDSVVVFQAGRKYNHERLWRFAFGMMAKAKSLEAIASDKILMEMDESTLVYLLKQSNLAAKEVELFNIALQWGRNQAQMNKANTAQEALADVIRFIRFPVMTLNEFTSVVVPTGLLKQDVVMEIFTYFGSDNTGKKALEESLKFSTAPRMAAGTSHVVSFYNRPNRNEEMLARVCLKDGIRFRIETLRGQPPAIASITLRCPVKKVSGSPGQSIATVARNEDDFFQLSVSKFPHTNRPVGVDRESPFLCQTVMVISPVKLEWGQEMEVKVEPPAVLRDDGEYFITLQQVRNSENEYLYSYQSPGSVTNELGIMLNSSISRVSFMARMTSSVISVIREIRLVEH